MADKIAQINNREVKASLGDLRMSPRKVRLVTDLLNQRSVLDARTRLRFTAKKAAGPVLKLINSAVANASNNFQMDVSKLFIKSIYVDQGTPLVRYKPRAQGRVSPVKHRISKVNIILVEKSGLPTKKRKYELAPPKKFSQEKKASDEEADEKPKHDPKLTEEKSDSAKPEIKRPQARKESRFKKGFVDMKKRLFNRKTGA